MALWDGGHHLLGSDLDGGPDGATQLTVGVVRALIWCGFGVQASIPKDIFKQKLFIAFCRGSVWRARALAGEQLAQQPGTCAALLQTTAMEHAGTSAAFARLLRDFLQGLAYPFMAHVEVPRWFFPSCFPPLAHPPPDGRTRCLQRSLRLPKSSELRMLRAAAPLTAMTLQQRGSSSLELLSV